VLLRCLLQQLLYVWRLLHIGQGYPPNNSTTWLCCYLVAAAAAAAAAVVQVLPPQIQLLLPAHCCYCFAHPCCSERHRFM
jgi:hypothetical protein